MAKRYTKKAKERLIRATFDVAIPILRLSHYSIELVFDTDIDCRADCEVDIPYRTAIVRFDLKRIRMFECPEFAVHELCHIPTWALATLAEELSEQDPQKAIDLYEDLTTELSHMFLPFVLDQLEARGELPPEVRDQPNVIVSHAKRKRVTEKDEQIAADKIFS